MAPDNISNDISGPVIIGNGRIWIGTITRGADGALVDERRLVTIPAAELARHVANAAEGVVGGSNGTCKTLLRTEDGRYLVHTEEWSTGLDSETVFSYTVEELDADAVVSLLTADNGNGWDYGQVVSIDELLG